MIYDIHWKRVRFLLTNKCNYQCGFCHNEGQKDRNHIQYLSLDDFKILIDILKELPLLEICLSGGEPFLNSDVLEMIEYADKNTTFNISCASNFSLISYEKMEKLSNTRIKFNIQFPYVDEEKFRNSTRTGDFRKILHNIDIAKNLGIQIGLNCVIQDEDFEDKERLIEFALKKELPIKFLPEIGKSNFKETKKIMYPLINKYAVSNYDKKTGSHKWKIKKGDLSTTIQYIDSPCFYGEISTCKNYGELRIQPDLSIQQCIIRNPIEKICLAKGKEAVFKQLEKVWKNFNHC